MKIRPIEQSDKQSWSQMRTALWPDTHDQHLTDIDLFFTGKSDEIDAVFVAQTHSALVGFIELRVRDYAEGSRHRGVPYVEGWYVTPAFQNQGAGKLLMEQAQRWALSKGFCELASDAEIDNQHSIERHKSLGFVETDRIVCFLKSLNEN